METFESRIAMTVLVACAAVSACAQPAATDAPPAAVTAAAPVVQQPKRPAPLTIEQWQPNAQQRATLDSLPKDVEEQRKELVRLAKIPLPTYEERRRFLDLMGDGFPEVPFHPLRANETFLEQYYRSQPKPSQAELDELVASLKKRMLFVQGGTFTMGDFGTLTKEKLRITYDENNPPHQVTLDSYSIMNGRVTHGEFDLFTRATGRPIFMDGAASIYRRRPGYTIYPVTWTDADAYCRWLSEVTSQPFALPTEAQWEYAARERGKFIAYPVHSLPGIKWANEFIPESPSVDDAIQAAKAKAGKGMFYIDPRPPGLIGANRIGMQDLVGGEDEWVSDWYSADYFKQSTKLNPRGPSNGTERVLRRGAYGDQNVLVRRSARPDGEPSPGTRGAWFRCAIQSTLPWR
jgi:formylglycine-generating enzyme